MEPSAFLKSQAKINEGAGSRRHGDVSMFSWVEPSWPRPWPQWALQTFPHSECKLWQVFQVHHPWRTPYFSVELAFWISSISRNPGSCNTGMSGSLSQASNVVSMGSCGYLWLAGPLFLGACSALTEFSECPLPMLLHSTTHLHCLHHASRLKENNQFFPH